MDKLLRHYITGLIVFMLGTMLVASSLQNIQFAGHVAYNHHMAMSQTDNGFPMQAGFPIFLSNTWVMETRIGLQTKATQHWLAVNFQPQSQLSSNNGQGLELLLTDRSKHFRAQISYGLRKKLLRMHRLYFAHGFDVAALYTDRQLTYLSRQILSKQDLNIGLGPVILLKYPLSMGAFLQIQFKGLFYLPPLSTGQLSYQNAAGTTYYNTRFHPFTYADDLTVTLHLPLYAGQTLIMGYRQTDFLGFACPQPPYFNTSGAVTYRLERNRAFFIGLIYGIRKGDRE